MPPLVRLIVWGVVAIALNVGLARFTYGVVLPSLRRDLGIDYLASGALNAVHLLGYLIGTLAAPALARRTSMPRLSVGAHLLVAAGAAACALAPIETALGYPVLALGRLATGLGAGAGIVAVLVLVFAAVSAGARPKVSAIVWSGMGVAIVASGFVAPWLSEPQIGWRSTFVVAAIMALGVALATPRRQPGDSPTTAVPAATADGFHAHDLMRSRWIYLIVSYLLFGIGYIAYSTFAGARLAATQASLALVSVTWIVFGFASIAGAALTIPILASRAKRFTLTAALLAGGIGAFAAFGDSAQAALLGALLVGLGLAATPSLVTAFARERCTAEDYATVFSAMSAALGIGQLAGPVVAGALADLFGTAAVPLFAASAYLAAAGFALLDVGWTGGARTQLEPVRPATCAMINAQDL